MSQMGQFNFTEVLNTLTGNTGDIVTPQVGNINILGSGHFSFNGNDTTATLTLAMDGGIADTYTTDAGNALPINYILRVLGGDNINTSGATNAVTINLDSSIVLPVTNSTGTEGLYSLGANRFMHNRGTSNTFLGQSSGALGLTVATAINNTGLGANCLTSIAISTYATGTGANSLTLLTGGSGVTAYGAGSGSALLTGSNDIFIGKDAGSALVSNESNSILIGNVGVATESNKTRIGSGTGTGAGQQDACYISGIYGKTTAATSGLMQVDSVDKLGVTNSPSITGDWITTNSAVSTAANSMIFQKDRTAGVLTSGDALGNIHFKGHDGTSYVDSSKITSTSSGTIATGRVASNLEFWTHPDSVVASTQRMVIASTGDVTINAPDSGVGLTINAGGETITAGDLLLSAGNIATTAGNVTVGAISADHIAGDVSFKKSRTGGVITALDELGNITFQGHDGTGYVIGAAIIADTVATIATNRIPTTLSFLTHPDSTNVAKERVLIDEDGQVWIDTPDAGNALTVGGSVLATTFDTNVVAAAVTLTGTTLSADGTDVDININITAKGTGTVIIDELTLTTDLAVTEGGTGASTFTDHGVLLGSGATAISATAVGGTGVILTGVAGNDPTWTTATYPATVAIGDVLVASNANVIGVATGGTTAGYALLANGAGTAPTFQAISFPASGIQTLAGDTGTATGSTVTIAGGSNITTSATSATLTVDLDNSITLSGDVTALNLKTSTVATNLTLNSNNITSNGTGSDVDINLIAKGAGGLTFDGIATGYSDSQWHLRQSELQTSDATPTTLVTIALAEGEMLSIWSTINGFQSDFTDAAGASVTMTAYRPTGGNVTQIGEEIINLNATSTANVTADVNVGTQSIIIQVAGVAAETWNWVSTHQYMFTKTNA